MNTKTTWILLLIMAMTMFARSWVPGSRTEAPPKRG
jgi:hypothetical protein